MLGVTPPISSDPPKPEDLKSSEGVSSPPRRDDQADDETALMADLVAMNQFESDAERKVRYVIPALCAFRGRILLWPQ